MFSMITPEMAEHYHTAYEVMDINNEVTFHGCIAKVQDMLEERYPGVQFIECSPIYTRVHWKGEDIGEIITIRIYT